MITLSSELGHSKGLLKEVEIGKYQIGLLSKETYILAIVQDSYDNEPFTRKILDLIWDNFELKFKKIPLNSEVSDFLDYHDELKIFIETMTFPIQKIYKLNALIEEFFINMGPDFDIIMITDLDEGIVKSWNKKNEDSIENILLGILSELPIEKSWLGEMTINHITEIWFIQRIGITDFCLCGRGYFTSTNIRDILIKNLNLIEESIMTMLFS